jgi:hypothetical protein
LPTTPDPTACVQDADCAIVYGGCYCGAQPATGVSKTYSAAATECQAEAEAKCALGCAVSTGKRAQDGQTTLNGTIGVRCSTTGTTAGTCQTFVE